MTSQAMTIDQKPAFNGKPKMPVVYEEAVNALEQCLHLDDAKYFDNQSDALAAWAKIYRDGKVMRQARALKLLAYRKMGELSYTLSKTIRKSERKLVSPHELLISQGLTNGGAIAARELARLPQKQFDSFTKREHPPSPSTTRKLINLAKHSEGWQMFNAGSSITQLAVMVRRTPGRDMAHKMTEDERRMAKRYVVDIYEWRDSFLQYCDKGPKP